MQAKGSSKENRRYLIEGIAIGVSFLLVLSLCLFLSLRPKATALSAEIVQHGQVVQKVDLSHDQDIDLASDHGHMHLVVQNGKIAVTSSPCKTQYCVHQGYKGNEGETILCAYEGVGVYLLGDSPVHEVIV